MTHEFNYSRFDVVPFKIRGTYKTRAGRQKRRHLMTMTELFQDTQTKAFPRPN